MYKLKRQHTINNTDIETVPKEKCETMSSILSPMKSNFDIIVKFTKQETNI